METTLIETRDKLENALDTAAGILKRGGVIAFPTDTIYGLGALISNGEACRRIYTVKKRLLSLPLSAHLPDIESVNKYCYDIPDTFYKIAEKYMPGPVTLIMKKRDTVLPIVTGGKDTLGVRIPNNDFMIKLTRLLGEAVAGTSANLSGEAPRIDPLKIKGEFEGKIEGVVDDGLSEIGIASTVISLVDSKPVIIRKGAVSKGELEDLLGMRI